MKREDFRRLKRGKLYILLTSDSTNTKNFDSFTLTGLICMLFLLSTDFFFQNELFLNIPARNTIKVSNNLDLNRA